MNEDQKLFLVEHEFDYKRCTFYSSYKNPNENK